MEYKIIASDLDGTLLKHDAISEENKTAIKEVLNFQKKTTFIVKVIVVVSLH